MMLEPNSTPPPGDRHRQAGRPRPDTARRAIRRGTGIALAGTLAAAGLVAAPAAGAAPTAPWSGTPGVFEENRLPATARTVPQNNASSALHAPESASRWFRSLNGRWSFDWAADPGRTPDGFQDPATDVSGWDVVDVPHNWQLDGYGDEETGDLVYLNQEHPWQGYGRIAPPEVPYEHNSVGSYRRDFDVPGGWKNRRTVLAFQGVKSAFTVWVNGEQVGYSEDSYAPAEFDVTDAVHPGTNTVAVQVHRWSDGSWLENQDMIDLSGIFRDVEMYSVPQVHLDDVTVTTDLDEQYEDAVLAVEGDLVRTDADAAGDALRSRLYDADGRLVTQQTLDASFDADGRATVTGEMAVDSPKLWSAEHPNLYTLVQQVLDGDDVVETTSQRVGFREFGLRDGVMALNGHTLDIKGVNRGEMHPDTGQALTDEQIRTDLELMRRNNITAVRTAHYPADPDLYRIADEIGMYVMDEANLESHDMRPFPGNDAEWYDAVFDRTRSMYERDKNHASVLWWSLGNEVGSGPVFQDMAAWLRTNDPGRLIHFQQDDSLADIDGNFYPSISSVQQIADRGSDKPWIMSEYEHAMGNSVGNIEEYWDIIDSSPDLQGGFIWDWADQAVRLPVDGGVDGLPVADGTAPEDTYFSYGGDWGDYATDGWFEINGLVLPDRTEQPELDDVKAAYAPVDLVEQDLENGRVKLRNEYLDTDLAALDVTWEVREDDETVGSGTLDVSLEPGAEGWVDLPIEAPADPAAGAEHWVTLTFRQPEATAWSDAGHEVATIQAELPWSSPAVPELLDDADGTDLDVAQTNDAVTVTGDDFAVEVDARTGVLASFTSGGRELVADGPAPNFWRAPTQNDVQNNLASRAAPWRDAGENVTVDDVSVREMGDGAVQVQMTGTLPTPSSPQYRLGYVITGAGDVVVRSTMAGEPSLAELPAMGTELTLPADLDQLTWLGRGAHETWADRDGGAQVGVWSSDVADQFFPQVVPQATGNHTGVRWATLTDDAGDGLMVGAIGDPLEVTALHQDEAAIEAAAHPFEVASDDVVHLSVDGAQQGLGNSWGEPALPQYTLQSSEPRSMQYVLRAVHAGDDVNALTRRSLDLDLVDDITVDGESLDGFHPDVTDYTIQYSSATDPDVPEIAVAATSPDVEVEVTRPDELPGTAVVTVTSADGMLSTTYTIHLEVIDRLYLSDVDPVSAEVGWGTFGRDVTIDGSPIQLRTDDGVATFEKGLGVHANATVVYDLTDWDFSTFRSMVGVEQHAARDGRPFVFRVLLDGEKVWESDVMVKSTPAVPVEVELGDAAELTLQMWEAGSGNGHGHGAWGDARLGN